MPKVLENGDLSTGQPQNKKSFPILSGRTFLQEVIENF
jgi:hypothetical protein